MTQPTICLIFVQHLQKYFYSFQEEELEAATVMLHTNIIMITISCAKIIATILPTDAARTASVLIFSFCANIPAYISRCFGVTLLHNPNPFV